MPVIALNYNPNIKPELVSLFIEENFNFNELETIEFNQSNKNIFTEPQSVVCRKLIGKTIDNKIISIVITSANNSFILCHVTDSNIILRTFILQEYDSFFRVIVYIYTFVYQEMYL